MSLQGVTLVSGEYYHLMNKSIAGYEIFNSDEDYRRMLWAFVYYQYQNTKVKFSVFIRDCGEKDFFDKLKQNVDQKRVEILAYCLMPTHIHLVVRQLTDEGISRFMANIQNSYAKFFNMTHGRKGHLWESRFKAVLVEGNDQMLHLSRYVHLNPTTSGIVRDPEEWKYSSYKEYLEEADIKICDYKDVLDISPQSYKEFCLGYVENQKEKSFLKKAFPYHI